MKIENVSVLVTGGASGLGQATARAMAERGARVAILDKNAENVDRTAAATNCLGVAGDVTDEVKVRSAIEKISSINGPPRVLVNCAGIGEAFRTVGKKGAYPLDNFKHIIAVNLVGTFNVLRLVAESMTGLEPLGEERGVILNTASVAAYEGQIGQAAYAASKGGVVAMTLPVARDLAQFRIRVNAIAPGLFMTPLLSGLSEEARHSIASQIPHPSRLGLPEEYAALAIHIVENPMLNGETIRLDGAVRMGPK